MALKYNSCSDCPGYSKSFLNSLNSPQLESCKSHSIKLSLKKGQHILTRQQEPQGVFCIKSGVVKVFLKDQSNKKSCTVWLRTMGESIGLQNLYDGNSDMAFACLTDTEACFFSNKVILKNLDRSVKFANKISSEISKDLNESIQYLSDFSFRSIKQRVVNILLSLKKKVGITFDGYINIPLNGNDLAELICTNRESVYRELSYLKKKKLIHLNKQMIRIENEDLLKKISNE